MYKGKSTISKESNLQNYYSVGGTLAEINYERWRRNEPRMQWTVHGLKDQDQVIESVISQKKEML